MTTLEKRRVRGDLIQVYKVVNEVEQVSWLNEPHLGHERVGQSSKFILENVKDCRAREMFFINRALKEWNSLPDWVKQAPSVGEFKGALDRYGCYSSSPSRDEFCEE